MAMSFDGKFDGREHSPRTITHQRASEDFQRPAERDSYCQRIRPVGWKLHSTDNRHRSDILIRDILSLCV